MQKMRPASAKYPLNIANPALSLKFNGRMRVIERTTSILTHHTPAIRACWLHATTMESIAAECPRDLHCCSRSDKLRF
ncbi:hypothetical protein BKA56DRAFT_190103 [Ilyonectria sp. MPI-CAGE-AT-0026]|nr:hypothetical protein BKA56DRAFT_190103 [Ilyonectria sp. MPI-CAGE-AT-0026]